MTITLIILASLMIAIGVWNYLFYPRQLMPVGDLVEVATPEPERYHNDCVHPCIRQVGKSYLFVHSPLYKTPEIENPIVYWSQNYRSFTKGFVVAETPQGGGFNSDPNVYYEDGICYVLYREAYSPFCEQLGTKQVVLERHATIDLSTGEFGTWSEPRVLIKNDYLAGDVTQCPILVKQDGKYRIYAAYYQYHPKRESVGLAIWESNSLQGVDCKFVMRCRGG